MKQTIGQGVKAAWPICLGYGPIGLAFGVLAQKAGVSSAEIALMSLLVFAGSSQFIAVSMLSTGAAAFSIIATTFMVNLRHVLMSSALAVYMQNAHRGFLSAFAYGVTDESFAINMSRFQTGHWHRLSALALNQAANATWFVATVAGGYVGRFIPAGAFGIDYALVAMFLCLIVFQLRGRIYVVTALFAGVLAVVLALLIPGNSYIVIASVAAATMGLIVRRRKTDRRRDGVRTTIPAVEPDRSAGTDPAEERETSR